MRELTYPARGYDRAPDWCDLQADFAGSSLLFWGVTVDELARRARGQLAFLAVPYAELSTGRALVADHAAEWRWHLLPHLVCISPAVDAETLLYAGRASVNPADDPAGWQHMCRRYLRAAGLVVIPPVEGWAASREVYQVAGSALNALRPVYVLKGGV